MFHSEVLISLGITRHQEAPLIVIVTVTATTAAIAQNVVEGTAAIAIALIARETTARTKE